MKVGSSPFVLVVESLNQKTGVRHPFRIRHPSQFSYPFFCSLGPNLERGFWSVN